MRRIAALSLLLAFAAGLVLSQDKPGAQFRKLRGEFRDLERTSAFGVQRAEQVRILKEMAGLRSVAAFQFLVDLIRNPKYTRLHDEALRLLAVHAPDSVMVASLFKEYMGIGNPHRELAREFLLARAIRRRDDAWLQSLFQRGSLEDRFLALQGMGEIGSTGTLDAARRLARDPRWQPKPDTEVNCGTIAASLKDLEGAAAARLLLLLRKDERFTEADRVTLREATRLWARSDPRDYVDIHELAQPDPDLRRETAAFLGAAGIEEARAPLERIARNPAELPALRATAAEALGGLALARGHLAATLIELARDENVEVARGAVRGLGRLPVRQSAEQLVELLDGPLATDARAALIALSGLPADTDWAVWLKGPRCRLPRGT